MKLETGNHKYGAAIFGTILLVPVVLHKYDFDSPHIIEITPNVHTVSEVVNYTTASGVAFSTSGVIELVVHKPQMS